MRSSSLFVAAVVLAVAMSSYAEEVGPPVPTVSARAAALTPSNTKFNSAVSKSPKVLAPAGQALTATGLGQSVWANIKGSNIDSGTASSGMVLTANGAGMSVWGSIPSTAITGTLGNAQLANSALTVTAGTGLTGGGSVSLGGSTTLSLGSNLTLGGTTNGTFGGPLTGNVTGNVTGTASNVTGVVAIPNGGTGSATQNFVDLSTVQSAIGGNKTFTGNHAVSTAFVVEARPNNTGGSNIFVGAGAGTSNTSGGGNNFIGAGAGASNTTGISNVFIGTAAGNANGTNQQNTFVGTNAGILSTADLNTIVGSFAGIKNTTGANNAFFGQGSGNLNTTGANNTFLGEQAGMTNTTGSNNIVIGQDAGSNLTTGSNNIDIGNAGVTADSNTIRIGVQGTQLFTFIAGVNGATSSGGVAVFVNGSGQLGTLTSSRRFKQNIADMNSESSALLKLRPVTFQYKPELDAKAIPQFGLIAEEVNEIDPRLVVRDDKGEIYTVRYEQINAMLLNEFLKEHKKVEALEKHVADLEAKDHARDERLARIEKALGEDKPSLVPAAYEAK